MPDDPSTVAVAAERRLTAAASTAPLRELKAMRQVRPDFG